MNWMEALASASLLPALFGILRQVYKLSDEPVSRVRVGYGSRDVVNPTIEAINRIGGRAAVAGYDELIAEGGDFRWLAGPRDRLAANELTKDGKDLGQRPRPESAFLRSTSTRTLRNQTGNASPLTTHLWLEGCGGNPPIATRIDGVAKHDDNRRISRVIGPSFGSDPLPKGV
jgi:hypothetical protein